MPTSHLLPPTDKPKPGTYIPVDVLNPELVGIYRKDFDDRHADLRNRVITLRDMATDMLAFLDKLDARENDYEFHATNDAAISRGLQRSDNRFIDSRSFLKMVATISHASDVAADAFRDAVKIGYETYLIPAGVLESVADRNRITLARGPLSDADRIDNGKYSHARRWTHVELHDHLDDIRKHYGFSGGHVATSRSKAHRTSK